MESLLSRINSDSGVWLEVTGVTNWFGVCGDWRGRVDLVCGGRSGGAVLGVSVWIRGWDPAKRKI